MWRNHFLLLFKSWIRILKLIISPTFPWNLGPEWPIGRGIDLPFGREPSVRSVYRKNCKSSLKFPKKGFGLLCPIQGRGMEVSIPGKRELKRPGSQRLLASRLKYVGPGKKNLNGRISDPRD